MKNFKKVVALVLALSMILSMGSVTFAADVTDASKLVTLGLLADDSEVALAETLTRDIGIVMVLKALGFTQADADAAAATEFTDVTGWLAPWANLAYAEEITLGTSTTELVFSPKAELTADQFLTFVLRKLGIEVTALSEAVALAETNGLVAAGYTAPAMFTKGNAADIAFMALGADIAGVKLIDTLVADGKVTLANAQATGLVAIVTDLKVTSVTATNLLQAVVTYNQAVDKDTATDKDNYDFATADKITVSGVSLSEDQMVATVTFTAAVAQQLKATLTVSGVKSAAGDTITKVATAVSFLDNTMPSILSTSVVGVSTIKVVFSEPMDPTSLVNSAFKVNDGKYYIKSVTGQKNNTEFLVELYTSLKSGDLPFEVKVGPKDYAGFTAMGLTTTLTVVEDTTAPVVVSFKDAKPNSVVLVWSEDIVLVAGALANYYHTNASNTIAANLTAAEIDGNEMTLTFADGKKLPNGTAYTYVLKDAVKDLWNNKNAQQMTKVDVTVDNAGPVLQSVNFKAENKIQIVFDEAVTKANVKANYTLLDKAGKEVTGIFSSFDTATAKKVTINFTKNLDGGDYTLAVKNVEDVAGNVMAATSMPFTVTDKTAPIATDFAAKLYLVSGTVDQIIKVTFGEAMAVDGAYSVADLSKYVLATGGAIEDLDDVTIAVVDDGKAVEITIPNTSLVVTSATNINIARIADAAGNYTVALVNAVNIAPAGVIIIDKAELTGPKEVKVYFSSELAKFEASDLIFTNGGAVTGVTTELVKGKTVATYTLTTALVYDASNLVITTKASGIVSENSYGEKLDISINPTSVVDKLAPAIAQVTVGSDDVDDVVTVDSNNDGILESIIVTYEEDLFNNFTQFSYGVEGHKVTGVTEVAGVVTIALDLTVDDNDDALVAAWDQTPVVTQLLAIYDDPALNKLAATSEIIDSIDEAAPVALTATENATSKVITLTFGEALKASTVIAANFTCTTEGITGVTPTVAYVAGSKTVTLTFASALVVAGDIDVTTNIQDVAGNAVVAVTFTRSAGAAGAGTY